MPTITMATNITSLLVFISLISIIPALVSAVNYCPPFWTHYQLHKATFCYRYFGVKASWFDAETQCTKFTICEGKETAHLLSITSMEEEEFVVQYWKSMTGPYKGETGIWMGYTKESPTTPWNWTTPTATPIKQTHHNWLSGYSTPDSYPGCAQQRAATNGRPYWCTAPCDTWLPFMCKMRAM